MIERLRKRSRSLIAHALYYSGVLWLMAAMRFHRKAVVLTYHRVLPSSADTFSSDAIVVRPDTFARQMSFLRRHFRLLSIEELADHFASGKELPSRSCVVTFDDGWHDNFEYALPILREQNVPAVIFVATDYIGGNTCFWQERLTRQLFMAVQHGGEALSIAAPYLASDVSSMTIEQQRSYVRLVVDSLKQRPQAEVEDLETRLREVLDRQMPHSSSVGDDRFMSWEQVTDLTRGSRVAVGAHGCSHTPLTALSDEQTALELRRSRELITSAIARSVIGVAYPNGNFSDAVIEKTKEAGYRLGFTTDKGPVSAADHPLKLTRINMHEGATGTMPEFLCAILLVFQRLRRSTTPLANAHTRNG